MVELNRIAPEVKDALEGIAESMPESCQQVGETVKQYVEENPVAATAITFGVGLGIGVLATAMMRSAATPTHHNMANRLGQMMLDKAGAVLPDSLVERFS